MRRRRSVGGVRHPRVVGPSGARIRHVTEVEAGAADHGGGAGDAPRLERCRWCGRAFALAARGRPRLFCRQACRQSAYVAGRRRDELGLTETELIVTRQALEDLRDRLYVLEAAVEDVERDLGEEQDERSLQDAVEWLLAAAKPLAERPLNFT